MDVVILDDERIIRRGLEKILRDNFPDINIVASLGDGQEAVDFFIDHHVDLLITDIRMPHMDGLSIMKMLQEEKPDTGVIVISGYDDFKYCRQALKYHAFDYILKPVDKAELINIIQRYYEQWGQGTEVCEGQISDQEKKVIRDIKFYLKRNYAQNVSLKTLSEEFHLNAVYISQMFKKETGESLTEYVLKIRMIKAAGLLRDTDLQIQEIADKVGYSTPKQFSAAFRRYHGVIPSEYRNSIAP